MRLRKLNYKKDSVEELWNYFKGIQLNISIDGVYDVYDYIRQPGNYETVKENIVKIAKHPKISYIGAKVIMYLGLKMSQTKTHAIPVIIFAMN